MGGANLTSPLIEELATIPLLVCTELEVLPLSSVDWGGLSGLTQKSGSAALIERRRSLKPFYNIA